MDEYAHLEHEQNGMAEKLSKQTEDVKQVPALVIDMDRTPLAPSLHM